MIISIKIRPPLTGVGLPNTAQTWMMITATKKAYAMWSIHRLTMVTHYNYNTATVCYTNQWLNTCSINGITYYTVYKLSIYREVREIPVPIPHQARLSHGTFSQCRPLRGIRGTPQLHNGSAKVINNGHHLTLTIHFVASLLNGGRVCIHLLYCICIVISISVFILDVALQIHYRTRCTHSQLWVYCGILEARGRCIYGEDPEESNSEVKR